MNKNVRKVAEGFYTFLATPDEMEKYVKLIGKTPEEKIMMQSSSSDEFARHSNIKILNFFFPQNYN